MYLSCICTTVFQMLPGSCRNSINAEMSCVDGTTQFTSCVFLSSDLCTELDVCPVFSHLFAFALMFTHATIFFSSPFTEGLPIFKAPDTRSVSDAMLAIRHGVVINTDTARHHGV